MLLLVTEYQLYLTKSHINIIVFYSTYYSLFHLALFFFSRPQLKHSLRSATMRFFMADDGVMNGVSLGSATMRFFMADDGVMNGVGLVGKQNVCSV
jgi:hypothetical protein